MKKSTKQIIYVVAGLFIAYVLYSKMKASSIASSSATYQETTDDPDNDGTYDTIASGLVGDIFS